MTQPNHIRYLTSGQIDRLKWDACIDSAHNGLVYGYSWYLDHMARHWHALVMNDYEAIMPLTWNKKYGIAYLYQPAFTQQLGIFSHLPVQPALVSLFIKSIPARFRFIEIFLNYSNPCADAGKVHNNLVLPLQAGFEQVKKGFSKELLQNVNRAAKFNLQYRKSDDFSKAIHLFRKTYSSVLSHVSAADYANFESMCSASLKNKTVIVREVTGENEELLAICLFLKDHRRVYNLMSTTSETGRHREANHFLLYECIREFAGQDLILDMEGSDIPGIYNFYKKFGAVNEPYFFLRINNLPLIAKFLKRG